MLHRNPAQLVQLPKRERAKVMRAMSAGEAARFLTAAKEYPHGLIFAFALATGMRPEEYLSLRWKDIDFQKGTARVERVLCWRKAGGHYFKVPKTPQSRGGAGATRHMRSPDAGASAADYHLRDRLRAPAGRDLQPSLARS